jgi:hypothetical protein
MANLFQRLFWSSTKSEGSTPEDVPASATPSASMNQTYSDSRANLNLTASPIVEGYQMDIQNERKQQCIARGIAALEFLKEINEATGVLLPHKAICGATLAILNTIEVDLLSLRYCRILIDVFRLWIVTRRCGRRCRIIFINIVAYFNSSSTRWIRIR